MKRIANFRILPIYEQTAAGSLPEATSSFLAFASYTMEFCGDAYLDKNTQLFVLESVYVISAPRAHKLRHLWSQKKINEALEVTRSEGHQNFGRHGRRGEYLSFERQSVRY